MSKDLPIEPEKEQNICFSSIMKKAGEQEETHKFTPIRVENTFAARKINYKRSKRREGKPKLTA